MKYSVAALVAAAATVSAWSNDTVVYTTVVVDTYTTVCPGNGAVTFGGHTYTNTLTESSTIVITNCPCTISKPVYTTSSVSASPVAPAPPVYTNATTPYVPAAPTSAPGGSVGTTSVPSSPSPSVVPASGAGKAIAMSGASLAGLLGLAAYLL